MWASSVGGHAVRGRFCLAVYKRGICLLLICLPILFAMPGYALQLFLLYLYGCDAPFIVPFFIAAKHFNKMLVEIILSMCNYLPINQAFHICLRRSFRVLNLYGLQTFTCRSFFDWFVIWTGETVNIFQTNFTIMKILNEKLFLSGMLVLAMVL